MEVKVIAYWIYVDGKKFCFTDDKEQAENIAKHNNGIMKAISYTDYTFPKSWNR